FEFLPRDQLICKRTQSSTGGHRPIALPTCSLAEVAENRQDENGDELPHLARWSARCATFRKSNALIQAAPHHFVYENRWSKVRILVLVTSFAVASLITLSIYF